MTILNMHDLLYGNPIVPCYCLAGNCITIVFMDSPAIRGFARLLYILAWSTLDFMIFFLVGIGVDVIQGRGNIHAIQAAFLPRVFTTGDFVLAGVPLLLLLSAANYVFIARQKEQLNPYLKAWIYAYDVPAVFLPYLLQLWIWRDNFVPYS